MTSLSDFAKLVAGAKNTDPKLQLEKKVRDSIQRDVTSLFEQLEEKPEELTFHIDKEVISEIREELDSTEVSKPISDKVKELLSQDNVDRYLSSLKPQQVATQPVNQDSLVQKNLDDVIKKIKHLEQWVGRISSAGPGSGEVNFRWLDDVDRSSIDTPESIEHVLRYNPTTKKFYFGELSGDHREINSFTFADSGPGIPKTPRMLYYDHVFDTPDLDNEDGTTYHLGYDTYSRVHNVTANTLTTGTFVHNAFGTPNGALTVTPFIADGSMTPLLSIGVITKSIAPNGFGRATKLGRVTGFNTTGSDVGEVWHPNDILWAHPTLPGKMTNVQPTAPNVALFIGAVILTDLVDGIITVRYNPVSRLYYGSYYDTQPQYCTNPLEATRIRVNTIAFSSGFTLDSNKTQVIAQYPGLFNFQFSLQIKSTNAAVSNAWVWYRKGVAGSPSTSANDVPYSATEISIASNTETRVAAWNFIVSLNAGEYFELMWAVDNIKMYIASPGATAFCPAIPSVILTAHQANL